MRRIYFLLSNWLMIFAMLGQAGDLMAQNADSESSVLMKVWMNDNTALELPVNTGTHISKPIQEKDTGYWYAVFSANDDNYDIYFNDIDRITFENGNSGIADNYAAEVNSWRFAGDGIAFDIATDSAEVSIHSIDGKMMIERHLPHGYGVISLAKIPDGIYILTIDNQSIKFAKK